METFGTPAYIFSDNGGPFIKAGNVFVELLSLDKRIGNSSTLSNLTDLNTFLEGKNIVLRHGTPGLASKKEQCDDTWTTLIEN
jgi:hypothetical protein